MRVEFSPESRRNSSMTYLARTSREFYAGTVERGVAHAVARSRDVRRRK